MMTNEDLAYLGAVMPGAEMSHVIYRGINAGVGGKTAQPSQGSLGQSGLHVVGSSAFA
jgi:hypothetical protein